MKKTSRKPGTTKRTSDLPAKSVRVGTAKDVRGGDFSLNYGKIEFEYKKQGADNEVKK